MDYDLKTGRTNYSFDFAIGDVVYLRIREEKVPGMITGHLVRPGMIAHFVTWSNTGSEASHFSFELSEEYGFVGGTRLMPEAVTLTVEEYEALTRGRDTVTIPRAEYESLKKGDDAALRAMTAERDRLAAQVLDLQRIAIELKRDADEQIRSMEDRLRGGLGWAHRRVGGA